eukprot:4224166-Pyramimonas_sp.AAC.1
MAQGQILGGLRAVPGAAQGFPPPARGEPVVPWTVDGARGADGGACAHGFAIPSSMAEEATRRS